MRLFTLSNQFVAIGSLSDGALPDPVYLTVPLSSIIPLLGSM